MSVPSYSFYSLPLKPQNKGMHFPFPPLKLSNKEMEEYYKIIFYSFPFIPFVLPNEVPQVSTSLSSLCLSPIHSFVPFFLFDFHTLSNLSPWPY